MHKMNRIYKPGDRWVECDVCGFGYRFSRMRLGVAGRQKGLAVCPVCFDPIHPFDAYEPTIRKEGVLEKVGGKALGRPQTSAHVTTLNVFPFTSADDGYGTAAAFNNTGNTIIFGSYAATSTNAFIRFPHVPLPSGITITSAYLTFTAGATVTATAANVKIYANDVDNAVAPTTYAGLAGLTLTTAATSWSSIASWTDGTEYTSDDITDVIQEVIDRSGWVSNNAIMVVIKDNSSTANAYREAESVPGDEAHTPVKLTVTYTI